MHRLWYFVDQTIEDPASETAGRLYALLAGGVAATLTIASQDVLHTDFGLLFGTAAIITSASFGGAVPAVIAGVMMSLTGLWLLPDHATLANPVNIAIISLFTFGLAIWGERVCRLRRREREHQQRLTVREAYLQSIFSRSPNAVIIISPAGEILSANASAGILFGCDFDAEHNVSIRQLIDFPIDGAPLIELGCQIVPGSIDAEPINGWRLDGTPIALSMRSVRTDIAGRPTIALHIHDETAEIAARHRMAVQQREVAQIGRAAALGTMGSAIAHELNQPLASAANFFGVVRSRLTRLKNVDVESVQEAVDEGLGQVFRASAILKRLRSFVQAAPVEREWTEVSALIHDAVRLCRPAFKMADAALTVEIDPDAGLVLVDRVQLHQVLMNLLINAAEAITDRPVRQIRLSAWPARPDRLRIRISDTGPGVSSAVRDRLFTPFSTSKTGGLGVGLAISRSIMTANGGSVDLEASSDAGATFLLTLERHETEERAHAA